MNKLKISNNRFLNLQANDSKASGIALRNTYPYKEKRENKDTTNENHKKGQPCHQAINVSHLRFTMMLKINAELMGD